MVSTAQKKKALHSLLASKLSNLTIPNSDDEFEFSDVFGPQTPTAAAAMATSSSAQIGNGKDPEVIHHRSHSFVGPSPRYILSKALPLSEESDYVLSEKEEEEEREVETEVRIGPGDFEILRVVGQGAFGKVFQVRKKNDGDGEGDGIYAMKVMKKETIIKKNHVDYMRAERDILTKVEHPFIVQLRYSFQVLVWTITMCFFVFV